MEQPKQEQPNIRETLPPRSSFFRSFGESALIAGVNTALRPFIADMEGRISEKYAKRSEERADRRNRQLILDTPELTTQGRRKAGLNPYGDPILPGMSSQSSIDTSGNPSDLMGDAFSQVMAQERLTLDEHIALERLNIDKALADAEIKEKNANTTNTIESLVGIRLANEIRSIEKEVAEFNFEQDKAKAPLLIEQLEKTVDKLWKEIDLLDEQIDLTDSQNELAVEELTKMIAQTAEIYSNIALNESNIALNSKKAQELVDRLEFDKQVEERVKNQGLAGLRIKAADIGLRDEQFNWEKEARAIEQELKDEGIDVNWTSLALDSISAIAFVVALVYSGGNVGAGTAARKVVVKAIRKLLKL